MKVLHFSAQHYGTARTPTSPTRCAKRWSTGTWHRRSDQGCFSEGSAWRSQSPVSESTSVSKHSAVTLITLKKTWRLNLQTSRIIKNEQNREPSLWFQPIKQLISVITRSNWKLNPNFIYNCKNGGKRMQRMQWEQVGDLPAKEEIDIHDVFYIILLQQITGCVRSRTA